MTSMFVKYLGMQNSGSRLSEAEGQGGHGPEDLVDIEKKTELETDNLLVVTPPNFLN